MPVMQGGKPKVRRITANLRVDLLESARRATGKGITQTLEAALELLRSAPPAHKARRLRGKLLLDLDLKGSRERTR
jgi:hypothetical protein